MEVVVLILAIVLVCALVARSFRRKVDSKILIAPSVCDKEEAQPQPAPRLSKPDTQHAPDPAPHIVIQPIAIVESEAVDYGEAQSQEPPVPAVAEGIPKVVAAPAEEAILLDAALLPVQAEPPKRAVTRPPVPSVARIVAWLQGMQWCIGLELSPLVEDLRARQQGNELECDKRTGRWYLDDVDSPIELIEREGKTTTLSAAAVYNNVLLMRFASAEMAYATRSFTAGKYLVIAPKGWSLLDAEQAEELVSLQGFAGHLVDASALELQELHLVKPDGTALLLRIPPAPELLGNLLLPGSEDDVPIYGSPAPRLAVPTFSDWAHLHSVEVCTHAATRTLLLPEEASTLEVPLEEDRVQNVVLKLRDQEMHTWSTFRFTYVPSVFACTVMTPLPVPESADTGHQPIPVVLKHKDGVECHAPLGVQRIASGNGGTTQFLVPADPHLDRPRIEIIDEAGYIAELQPCIERLWWRTTTDETGVWEAKPIICYRDDFAASSKTRLDILLPRTRWIRHIKAGFTGRRAKKYPVKVSSREVSVDLREFNASDELSVFGIHDFFVYFEHNGVRYETSVIRVAVGASCKLCDGRSDVPDAFAMHLVEHHIGELYRPITAEEKARFEKHLPRAIFHCADCRRDLLAVGEINEANVVRKHAELGCAPASLVQVKSHVDLRASIADSKICRGCQELFSWESPIELGRHYAEEHPGDVLRLTRRSSN